MKLTVRPGLKLALTLFFILAVYFQTIYNPFSRFDDPFIIEYYGLNSNISFLDVITPGSSFYYRPLVNLSYWLDFRLWGMDPTFMHLDNIIVHLANACLVFLIASRLPASSDNNKLPFLSALLFGLHPINSEPVNWIAGRTDVFAGLFVLLAVYFLLRAIEGQSTRFAVLSFLVAFVGTLTKETGIMFVPAAFLIIFYWPVVPEDASLNRIWRKRALLLPMVITCCLVSALLILVYSKRGGDNAIAMIFESGTFVFIRSFEALGFYVKKMFLPLPLNVAIMEVNSLYAILGIIALGALLVIFRRIGVSGVLLASAVLFTLPALVVATTSITWTPFGERYLYIPSAFAVIGSIEFSYQLLLRLRAVKFFVPIVCIIIALASIATFQRSMLWGDNLAMIGDIVAKSPHFGVARNEYGVLLKMAKRYDEASKQFEIASQQKNNENVNRVIRLNLIGMKLVGKQPEDIRNILLSEIGNKADADVELLKLINIYNESLLRNTTSINGKEAIADDIIDTNDKLYLKTHDPFYLYKSGQIALSVGNRQKAALYFRRAWEKAGPDAYYREPARILAEKLGKK